MPIFTEDELQTVIEQGRLCAISLDTNVFHRFGYNLEATMLLAMAQFAGRGVEHVVTEIVAREVTKHMVENEEKVSADLRDALRRYTKTRRQFQADVARLGPALGIDDDVAVEVNRRWDAFIATTHAVQLNAGDLVDTSMLADLYFELKAPFEASEEKKAEFPDGIALLELEGHGARKKGFVLAVSRDRGWAAFAETAQWVVVLDDLAAAIQMFHTADAIVAEQAVLLLADDDAALRDDVDQALGRFVDDLNPEIEAESFMEFSAEFLSAGIEAVSPVERTALTVIGSDAESVTFAVEIEIAVEIEADFAFYAHDSIDDDYLGMGSTTATRVTMIAVPVTLVVPRGITEEVGAIDVRVERLRPLTVNFGYVEPSGWRDEEQ